MLYNSNLISIGQKYGRLTVLKKEYSKNKTIYWKCLCNCGTEIIKNTAYLKNKKRVQSCGCYKFDCKEKNRLKERTELVGASFGRLTVISWDINKQL